MVDTVLMEDEDHAGFTPRKETYKSFLENPLGDGSSFQNRKLLKEGLYNQYLDLIKKHGDFKFRAYQVNNDILLHVMVPSETIDHLTYDVVVEFRDGVGKPNLATCNIRLFSNSPSFVFTYAYAFNKVDLVIKSLLSKLNRKAIEEQPAVKNTELITGYEKTIIYALRHIENKQLTVGSNYTSALLKLTEKKMQSLVASDEEKMVEYQQKKKAQPKKKVINTKKKVTSTIDKKEINVNSTFKVNNKVDNKISKVNNKVDNKISKVDNKVK